MQNDLTIATGAGSIPLRWVDEIFRRLIGRFGAQFADKYRDGNPVNIGGATVDGGIEAAKQVWAEELDIAGVTPEQIKCALAHRYAYPPTCDEFIRAAQGEIAKSNRDPEVLFYRAVTEMTKRRRHEPQDWPSEPVFWAAVALGDDLLRGDYKALSGRWRAALDANRERMAPIPDVKPDRAITVAPMSQEDVQVKIADVQRAAKKTRFPTGDRLELKWAYDIADEVERGVHREGIYPRQVAAEAIQGARKPVPAALQPYLPKTNPMEDAA
ncbi:hypothetical protein [Chromobacterium violaceum]|uniref:hypothetical protein n=1 Tax=Chromobacterium violaceum TaxID=536 RepID=UPI00143D6BE8|nr:hypothetical protein [Chromobacterium violaceum]QIY81488.1 hypothetical protein FOB43_20970 [Chromobacterium violaceum]